MWIVAFEQPLKNSAAVRISEGRARQTQPVCPATLTTFLVPARWDPSGFCNEGGGGTRGGETRDGTVRTAPKG